MGSRSKAQETTDKITRGQWLALAGLAVSAFIFNTSEFIPIGLLSDIGQTFSLTEAQTGIMISVYAWGVMVLSLPLMVFASRFDFRRLLLGLIAIFTTGQFLSAIAPTYLLLVCSRLVVATAHAVFWSVVMVVAARVVSPRHSSTAMGIVATGSSIAQIFGMPMGRAIGLMVGWRMTFVVVGVVALVTLVYLAVVFPPMSAGEKFTLDKLPELFRNGPLVALYVAIVFIATGQYVAYSYVEPFLAQTVALGASEVTAALVVIGCAGLLGSYLFSRFYDGHKKGFIAATLVGETLALLALLPAASSLGVTVAVLVVWGAAEMGFCVAFQSILIHITEKDQASVAMSIYSGLFNLGIGAGSAIGGVTVTQLGVGAVGLVGGAFAAVGTVVTVGVMFALMRRAGLRA
ncbi:MFS transporter, DHA1 family, L-arabinose/isopropyl-beta-D-thiogalactopyranoside export protein [Olsenella sp. KH3B4]|uniref:MFS transporter n=1 Tax=Olsenella sp. KH3B4 TaxID=1855394 RepID=UPI0008BC53D7|nr:MFS transporter [Olsenella sp. KH3B4]SET21465.1 MFS transporter, DHA1 family, L-arabinose/isopropyl-beta-D-thiogalactopyranoside export protein [Olsenella sp. KH3B4]